MSILTHIAVFATFRVFQARRDCGKIFKDVSGDAFDGRVKGLCNGFADFLLFAK